VVSAVDPATDDGPGGASSTGGSGGGSGSGGMGCPGIPTGFEDGGTKICSDLKGLLAHRYSFNGVGAQVPDSVGMEDGNLQNTQLAGDGTVILAGTQSDQFVDLPNRILSDPNLRSVTLEAWVLWSGGAVWQRIFDFGASDALTEGLQGGAGTSYLFLTTRTPVVSNPTAFAPQNGSLRVSYRRPGSREAEVTLDAETVMPSGGDVPTHVAVVIDQEAKRMSLYIDGVLQNGTAYFRNPEGTFIRIPGAYDWGGAYTLMDGTTYYPEAIDLSSIDDINSWLGRSQFQDDAELQGTYYEFRMYEGALTPEELAFSFQAGPDPEFLQ
jgi:hypothetical protein